MASCMKRKFSEEPKKVDINKIARKRYRYDSHEERACAELELMLQTRCTCREAREIIEVRDHKGRTPLMNAMFSENWDIATLLVDEGASTLWLKRKKLSPLALALRSDDPSYICQETVLFVWQLIGTGMTTFQPWLTFKAEPRRATRQHDQVLSCYARRDFDQLPPFPKQTYAASPLRMTRDSETIDALIRSGAATNREVFSVWNDLKQGGREARDATGRELLGVLEHHSTQVASLKSMCRLVVSHAIGRTALYDRKDKAQTLEIPTSLQKYILFYDIRDKTNEIERYW